MKWIDCHAHGLAQEVRPGTCYHCAGEQDTAFAYVLAERDAYRDALEYLGSPPFKRLPGDVIREVFAKYPRNKPAKNIACDCVIGYRGPDPFTCEHGNTFSMSENGREIRET